MIRKVKAAEKNTQNTHPTRLSVFYITGQKCCLRLTFHSSILINQQWFFEHAQRLPNNQQLFSEHAQRLPNNQQWFSEHAKVI
jgi:hypothetical protein